VICDNALLHGLALGRQPVDQDLVLEVCRDFRFGDGLAQRPDGAHIQATSRPDPPRRADHAAPEGERQGSDQGDEGDQTVARPRFSLFGGRRR
jgi:hypothetical protein